MIAVLVILPCAVIVDVPDDITGRGPAQWGIAVTTALSLATFKVAWIPGAGREGDDAEGGEEVFHRWSDGRSIAAIRRGSNLPAMLSIFGDR
jgi:hypothetical protein